jgi:hypothetical protein
MHKKTNLSINIDKFFPGAKKYILPTLSIWLNEYFKHFHIVILFVNILSFYIIN